MDNFLNWYNLSPQDSWRGICEHSTTPPGKRKQFLYDPDFTKLSLDYTLPGSTTLSSLNISRTVDFSTNIA
jgi:hypothetical protein